MSKIIGCSLVHTIENAASLIWEKVSYSTRLSESVSKEQELMHTRLVPCWSPHMVHYAPRVNYMPKQQVAIKLQPFGCKICTFRAIIFMKKKKILLQLCHSLQDEVIMHFKGDVMIYLKISSTFAS